MYGNQKNSNNIKQFSSTAAEGKTFPVSSPQQW